MREEIDPGDERKCARPEWNGCGSGCDRLCAFRQFVYQCGQVVRYVRFVKLQLYLPFVGVELDFVTNQVARARRVRCRCVTRAPRVSLERLPFGRA